MAISETMITSSSRFRLRSSTPSTRCPPGAKIPSRLKGRDQAALGLGRNEARRFIDPVDEILAEAALHFLVHWHQLGDPGSLFGGGLLMDLHFATRLDDVHRGHVVLGRRIVEEL